MRDVGNIQGRQAIIGFVSRPRELAGHLEKRVAGTLTGFVKSFRAEVVRVFDRLEKKVGSSFSGDSRSFNLKLVKILSVVVPGFFFWAIEPIRYGIFGAVYDSVQFNLVVAIVATGGAFFFSRVMFGEIESIQQQLVRRNEELTVLNTVASAVNQSLRLDVVLRMAMEKVIQATSAIAAEIYLRDEKTDELVPTAQAGDTNTFLGNTRFKVGEPPGVERRRGGFRRSRRFGPGEGPIGRAALSGEPVLAEYAPDAAANRSPSMAACEFDCVAYIPLKAHDIVVGVLAVQSVPSRRFKPDDIRLLVSTGAHIAVAIENARLHEREQAAATIEERERIAREMHDGVAQVLSYINVKTQAMKSYLSSGQTVETQAQIQELEDACQEAYADVRESILGLRLSSGQTALIPAVKELVLRFEKTSDLTAVVDSDDADLPVLSPVAEVQVIRIVQEAFTNIRKHAVAKRAWVRLGSRDGRVELSIVDDGRGFDPGNLPKGAWPHFGLRMMKERAECIGGKLEVSSFPGLGTRVDLSIPIGAS